MVQSALCDYRDFLRYPIDGSITMLGRKWAGPVLVEIVNGRNSFNNLLATVPGLNSRTLSAILDGFEKHGIIKRETAKSAHARIRYRLTRKGEDMRSLLREMTSYSLAWYPKSA